LPTDYKTVKKSKPIYARNSFINIKMSKEPACYYKLIQIINKGIWFFANTSGNIAYQPLAAQYNTWFWRCSFLIRIL